MPANILIIDDDPHVRETLRLVMRPKDYAIHSTGNGEIGLAMIDEIKPDLIILDLMLPGLSGLEIIKRVRSRPDLAHIPIIVISGIEGRKQRPEGFWREGLKIEEFIAKVDFDPADLLGRIEYLLRRDSYRHPESFATPPTGNAVAAPVAEEDLGEIGPTEVIRQYIEAWNRRDFGLEFECLDQRMTAGLTKSEYIQRRKHGSEEPSLQDMTQTLAEVVSVNRSGGHAAIRIRRSETRHGRPQQRSETFTLEQTPNGWRITGVKSSRI